MTNVLVRSLETVCFLRYDFFFLLSCCLLLLSSSSIPLRLWYKIGKKPYEPILPFDLWLSFYVIVIRLSEVRHFNETYFNFFFLNYHLSWTGSIFKSKALAIALRKCHCVFEWIDFMKISSIEQRKKHFSKHSIVYLMEIVSCLFMNLKRKLILWPNDPFLFRSISSSNKFQWRRRRNKTNIENYRRPTANDIPSNRNFLL